MKMIIDDVLKQIEELKPGDTQSFIASHILMLAVHTKALACHSECLGMNAENAISCCENGVPPFNQASYFEVMQKWGMVDEDGKVII